MWKNLSGKFDLIFVFVLFIPTETRKCQNQNGLFFKASCMFVASPRRSCADGVEVKFLFVRLCREVPSAAHQLPADAGSRAAIVRDLQPGSHVFAQPWKVRPLPHLQPGKFFSPKWKMFKFRNSNLLVTLNSNINILSWIYTFSYLKSRLPTSVSHNCHNGPAGSIIKKKYQEGAKYILFTFSHLANI